MPVRAGTAKQVRTSGYVQAGALQGNAGTTVTVTHPASERAFDALARGLSDLCDQSAGLKNDLAQIGDSLFGSIPRGETDNGQEVLPGRVSELHALISVIRKNLDEIRGETQRLFTL